jgi:hypothetical protein
MDSFVFLTKACARRGESAKTLATRKAKLCQVTRIPGQFPVYLDRLFNRLKVVLLGAMGEKPVLIGSAVACGETRFFKIFCILFHRLEKG